LYSVVIITNPDNVYILSSNGMLQWTNASHAHSHVPALGSAWQHKVSDRHTHQKPETNRRRAHRQSRKASGQSQLTRTTQVSCNLPFLLLTNTSLKKKRINGTCTASQAAANSDEVRGACGSRSRPASRLLARGDGSRELLWTG